MCTLGVVLSSSARGGTVTMALVNANGKLIDLREHPASTIAEARASVKPYLHTYRPRVVMYNNTRVGIDAHQFRTLTARTKVLSKAQFCTLYPHYEYSEDAVDAIALTNHE